MSEVEFYQVYARIAEIERRNKRQVRWMWTEGIAIVLLAWVGFSSWGRLPSDVVRMDLLGRIHSQGFIVRDGVTGKMRASLAMMAGTEEVALGLFREAGVYGVYLSSAKAGNSIRVLDSHENTSLSLGWTWEGASLSLKSPGGVARMHASATATGTNMVMYDSNGADRVAFGWQENGDSSTFGLKDSKGRNSVTLGWTDKSGGVIGIQDRDGATLWVANGDGTWSKLSGATVFALNDRPGAAVRGIWHSDDRGTYLRLRGIEDGPGVQLINRPGTTGLRVLETDGTVRGFFGLSDNGSETNVEALGLFKSDGTVSFTRPYKRPRNGWSP